MKIWKILRLSILQKNEKAYSEKNTKSVAEQPFDNKFMGLYEMKHYQFELKGAEMGQNEDRLLDFLDLTGWDDVNMRYSSGRWTNGPRGDY